ncbi:MAG: glycosyltransferase [Verrucomicrobiales bacterium]|nr:glycosyltransferase [Verrucomicrobiales bacterium]MCP5560743.1 glycosyltransferase [Verrucomicrobiaceae bacterium]
MRILLINQFIPPATPPTARLVGDLAETLRGAGHEVVCIGATSGYGPVRGVRRIWRDLTAHLKISMAVLAAGRCDWIVCLSDPTGLPFTASILARLKGARMAHWAMDVYPQVAVALQALKNGVATRAVGAAMRYGYQGCDLLVGLDGDMAKEIAHVSGCPVSVLPPWPPAIEDSETIDPIEAGQKSRRRWLYSGNLGRAHDFTTLLEAQRQIEAEGLPWELHFQGGGPCRQAAISMAEEMGLKHCHWSGYAPDDELLSSLLGADVLIATQLPETRGLLWPSKLALMQQLDLPILWIGPTEGQIAQDLERARTLAGVFANGDANAVVTWLKSLPPAAPRTNPAVVQTRVAKLRAAGMAQWCAWLTPIGG